MALRVWGCIENPHLYYEIQQGNDKTTEVTEQFRKVLNELINSVTEKDEAVFTRHMNSAKDRLSKPGDVLD